MAVKFVELDWSDPGKSKHTIQDSRKMSRNMLYLVIGGLAVVAMILGYQVYRERQKITGVEISIGERGISIEKK
ncbi:MULTISPECIES: hypothetical protein [unclassified Bradyrhizobium]|uniref:hypothetical protein n=1 Tax=unclassified Bradyrhizobium TaxID=2631580 RepID=UPI002916623D|nr:MULTISPECIES: hypothetical protein [unclassified Bradyrhizobium]